MLKRQKVGLEYDKSVNLYFKDVASTSPLTRDEELELWRDYKYNGNVASRDRLVVANLRFVANVARQYQGRGLSYSDLIAEGNLGLLRAIDKFDGERGYKVISYAVWWIKQSILEALEKRNASNDEDLPLDYEKPLDTDNDDYSIKINDDNYINDGSDANTEKEREAAINFLMDYLNKRERNIITKYYGLDGNKPKTLEEIGFEYGLTKERIRQIKNQSFKKMRSVALATGMTYNI